MTTDGVILKYENTSITFHREGESVMINATEMAKPFGRKKRPALWLRTKQAQEYIKELCLAHNSIPTDILNVVNGGKEFGTWMRRDLVINFSRWLSPAFAVWCDDRIEELLNEGKVSISEQAYNTLTGKISELKNTNKELEAETKKIESKVEELTPDAEFGKSVRHNSDSIPVTMFSDFLVSNGCNIGRNQLYEFFRENGYVHKKGESDRNFPTRRSTQMRILETRYPSSTTEFGPTVYVTPKGIKYFLRRKGMIEAFIERKKAVRKSKLFKRN